MQRKGICRNVGICNNANTHKIIVINDDNEPFECPECHEPLQKVEDAPEKPGSSNGKMIFWIIGGVLLAAIIGLAIWLVFTPDRSPAPEPETVAVDSTPEELPAAATIDSIAVKALADSIAQVKADSIIAAQALSDSLARVEADSLMQAQEEEKKAASASVKETKQPTRPSGETTSRSSTHKLAYGTWTGSLRNGQPHGTGTMTYTTSRTIDSRDTKGRVAQPGEYIVGEWDNGRLVQGRWFKKDGSKEAIIIGKAG